MPRSTWLNKGNRADEHGSNLLVNSCDKYGGLSFSGQLITAHENKQCMGLIYSVESMELIKNLPKFAHYCFFNDPLNVARDINGYLMINGKYKLIGEFKRGQLRDLERIINIKEIRERILLQLNSDSGHLGEVNEDSVAKFSIHDCENKVYLNVGVVGDGVGGLGRGDYASGLIVRRFIEEVANIIYDVNESTLNNIVQNIHEELYENNVKNNINSGSTIASIITKHKEDEHEADIYSVNVGDSLIYNVDIINNNIKELSVSDRLSGKNISQAVGYILRETHINSDILRQGNYIVVATDGIADFIDGNSIFNAVKVWKYPWLISRELMHLARMMGSKDDATILIVWFKD